MPTGKALTELRKYTGWLRHSVYAFPLLLIILLCLLTVFKINGSSTGIYYSMADGSKTNAPGSLYGKPQGIRSDEYLTTTVVTDLQSKTGFPSFNKDLDGGRDVAIMPDAPTKSWLAVFRPQNWSFFVLPFENAFAFRWWFDAVLLIIAAYFFILRIFNGKKFLAILLSIAFGLSPFLLWWYQSDLFIPMAYAFMMMILAIRIINQEKIPRLKSIRLTNVIYILALAYLGTSFVLFLYAPFLISIFIVVAVFAVGYLLNECFAERSITGKQALRRVGLMVAPLLIIAPILLVFYVQNKAMIHAVSHSLYPGHRLTASGELPFSRLYRFFDGFLMPLLQHPPSGGFYTNQSEAADFILLLPFLLAPGIALQIYNYWKRKRINWVFLLIQLLAILFILRITVPFGNGFYNLLLLDRVPNNRLMAGVGLVGFLQLIFLIKLLPQIKIPKRVWIAGASAVSLLTLAWLLVFSKFFFKQYLVFNHNHLVVGCLAVFFTVIVAAFLFGKRTLGAVLLLAFTVISSYNILPLQHGLPFLENSQVIRKIEVDSTPKDSWAVVDDFSFESLPLAAGRELVSGPQIYPDLNFWGQLDKTGQFKDVYNRQAHALFISDSAVAGPFLPKAFAAKMTQNFQLVKGNVFKIRFSCSAFVYKNVNYVLTTHRLNMPCTVPVDKAAYQKVVFYIYKIKPAG